MNENLETYSMTLQEERDYYCKCMKDLQQKIDKAIEYIKKLKNFKIKCVVLEEKELYASENDFVKELLEILDRNNNE